MPLTNARSVAQHIIVYNHKPTNFVHKYAFEKTKPLYPFGHGLSYTTFSISAPKLSKYSWNGKGALDVEVTVKNTGKMAGTETVQLYVRDKFSSVTRPVLELKAYDKISLQPGDSKKVRFSLTAEAFAYYNIDMKYLAEKGDFIIFTGNSSASKSLKKAGVNLTQNIYYDEK